MLDVKAQPHALAQLQRALHSGRLAHTWIFAGPFGVGKFKLAWELARTSLCDHPVKRANGKTLPTLPKDFELTLPCGTCESCRAIDTGNHPDLHVITKELIRYHDKSGTSKGTTLGINVIRGEITGDSDSGTEAKIYKRSFRGRGKWFLIDEADLMEVPAQNSLLKTLEEPPPESYLVLITPSPAELLSTIRSRSQLVTLRQLPDAVITEALLGRGLTEPDAQLLAHLASGSLGRAVRWAEDIATVARKNTAAQERHAKRAAAGDAEDEEADTKFTTGGILAWTRNLAAALDALVAGTGSASDVAGAIARAAGEYASLQLVRDPLTSKDQANRNGVAIMLGIAAEWFAERLRQGLGLEPAPPAIPLPSGTAGLDPTVVRQLLRTAREAEGQIDANVHVQLTLAAAVTQWEKVLRA